MNVHAIAIIYFVYRMPNAATVFLKPFYNNFAVVPGNVPLFEICYTVGYARYMYSVKRSASTRYKATYWYNYDPVNS